MASAFRTVYMHRYMEPVVPVEVVLREAQAVVNRNPGASKYKNVAWHEGSRKWVAVLTESNKQLWLGGFRDEVMAACVATAHRWNLRHKQAALAELGVST